MLLIHSEYMLYISLFYIEPIIGLIGQLLHSHNHDTYTYTCGNNKDERTHFFRKIYLSHFIRNGCERVMSERWVGDWTNCNILIPSSFVFSSTSFSFCWAAQSGVLRAHSPLLGAGSLSTAPYLQLSDSKLTEPVCGPGLYNCFTSTCFLWVSHLHPIQPVHSQGYTLISSTGCICSLIDAWIGGQYVTQRPSFHSASFFSH